MSKEAFAHVLGQIEGKTKNIYYHLMGEPLLHPELPTFIKMANERGLRSLITTNGTLLKERGECILESGIYKINISLHSFEGNDIEQQRQYLSDVVSFSKEAWKRGVIIVLRLWNRGVDGDRNQGILDFLKAHFEGVWEENERGIKIKNRLHVEWGERFEWPDMEAEEGSESVFCYGMRDHFGILVDGSVVPCCLDSEGAITLGNLFENSLTDILSTSRARAIRHGFGSHHATEELCRRCSYARRFK